MRYFVLFVTVIVTFIFILAEDALSQVEPSWSIGYDFLPYQGIDDPIEMPDGSMVNDAEVRLSRFRTAFTYPVLFSQGKTILFNEISYQRIGFYYHKTTSLIDRLHSVSYTLSVFHAISDKWSMLFTCKSSLASDLEVDIGIEDFSFQAAAIFDHHFSQKFSIGLGAAYSTQFGKGELLPLLSLEWNNGQKWSVKAILPSNLEIWYNLSQCIDLGLLVTGDGDNFRFDPGSYGDIYPEPNLRYTIMTIGLASKIKFSNKFSFSVEAGVIGLHRFEFYSGDDEIVSNDLEPSRYFRLGFQTNL